VGLRARTGVDLRICMCVSGFECEYVDLYVCMRICICVRGFVRVYVYLWIVMCVFVDFECVRTRVCFCGFVHLFGMRECGCVCVLVGAWVRV